jgi:hypothetical protein
MDWILNNLQVLIVIAIAVTAIVQKLKKAAQGEGGERPAATTPEEERERTRRIQEELRRKIMERRGLPSTKPGGEEGREFPAAPPMIEEVRPYQVKPPAEVAEAIADARIAAELKRQQEMMDRVRALEADMRSKAMVAASVPVAPDVTESSGRLTTDLQSRSGLRRAMVLREVLGPPIALR